MGKGKKKHSKQDQVADDILDLAAISVKKFRKVTRQVGKLSTAQKVVGSIALLAAGLTYLAKQDFDIEKTASPAPRLALTSGQAADNGQGLATDNKPAAPRKSRKPLKPKHES